MRHYLCLMPNGQYTICGEPNNSPTFGWITIGAVDKMTTEKILKYIPKCSMLYPVVPEGRRTAAMRQLHNVWWEL